MTDKCYIYYRDNLWFKTQGVYKIGITTSIKDRNNSYITGEIIRGKFIKILELNINANKLKLLDKVIKSKFKHLNVYIDGGTEFYKRDEIYNEIEQFLIKIDIKFKIIDESELNRLNRKSKVVNNYKKLILKLNSKTKIIPNKQQKDVLVNIKDFYVNNDIGKILWSCGIGKTLLSILITQQLEFKRIIIGVSSNYLQEQFVKEILLIFNNKSNILLIGSYSNATTNITKIKSFLTKEIINNEPLFIITTYHSSHLLIDNEIKFDFKIGDECHHLVGIDNTNTNNFKLFHKIQSTKTLFMTATEKSINNDDKNNYYSMNDQEKFGVLIDLKTTKWAIENNKITDYLLIIIKNKIEELEEIKSKLTDEITNKHLFICCYMALKSLCKYPNITHTLIYTNTINDANLCYEYIKVILSYKIININTKDIYYTSLHSKINNTIIKNSLKSFETAKFGIICCVQIFGEGVDCPFLTSVCIACNMFSETKIIQYLLRPNRLNKNKPDKTAYYLFPYIQEEDYQNIINIIRQLRNIDDNIEHKIKLSNITYNSDISNKEKEQIFYDIQDNHNELLKIKLRMKIDKTLASDFTKEVNEYNYSKRINVSLNIKSKNEYYLSRNIHQNYIENPDKYFTNNGVWTNWKDFLGYDTSLFLQTKTKWFIFCKENNINNLEDYNKAIYIFNELPKDPEDFYIDFSNIQNELTIDKNKSRRKII
jgi:predicted helicase